MLTEKNISSFAPSSSLVSLLLKKKTQLMVRTHNWELLQIKHSYVARCSQNKTLTRKAFANVQGAWLTLTHTQCRQGD